MISSPPAPQDIDAWLEWISTAIKEINQSVKIRCEYCKIEYYLQDDWCPWCGTPHELFKE